ncbi:LysM peptidoglycan-binding domain-containing protein [Streptomonospora salina]|uniref:Nucleoid-associated protein YgaU n=1 Tax=Streptomonospora salina TaxID=104205 RepID=A0A841ELV7_9ACTN|nr:LysM peptidoglycan-binding domain-containing protein [Streptomonospora salina]MBB6000401.1 nucleoid-associated protein YgaU [Streptomonospora salina]
MDWPDAPAPDSAARPGRRGRRSRLWVVPAQAPPPADESARLGGAAAADTIPGAHNGALFDWERQLPEWSCAESAAEAAAVPAQPAPDRSRRRPVHPDPEPARASRAPATALAAAVRVWSDRLTRRGRIVVGTAASVLATAALVALATAAATAGAAASGAAPESALREEPPSTVVVRDGDTLWDIAERVRPGDDPRSTVHRIVRVNGLGESELEPGQELEMPDF